MTYQVTARKWRPRRFDEVVGQEHITTTLGNAVRTGRIAHCYLFCGPRGVGKTTTARILAKLLNCAHRDGINPCDACPSCSSIAVGTSMDVLEIDGASNNSVDDVRELREVVRYVPTGGTYKIYIIDEVHMLSTAAFNALLKTLEEPPERVVFVFATTEVQQVPETILSRCQRFNFRRIPTRQIAAHLALIAEAEQIAAADEALYILAHRADGALRDAESLLDQVASLEDGQVTADGVRQVLGLVDRTVFFELSSAVVTGDARGVLEIIARVLDEGGDIEEFVRGFTEHASYLLHARVQGRADQLEVADAERASYEEAAGQMSEEDILRILRAILDLESDLRKSLQPRFRVEMALVRLARMGSAVDVGRLLGRLEALEEGEGPSQRRHREAPGAPDQPGPSAPAPTAAARPAETPADDSNGPPRVAAAAAGAASSGTESAGPESPSPAAQMQPDIASIKAEWDRIAADVARTNQSVGGFLREAAPVELVGSVLHLAFSPQSSFHMGSIEKNRGVAEQAIERLLGMSVRINCRLAEGEPANAGKKEADAPVDPAVRSVMDALDGELV